MGMRRQRPPAILPPAAIQLVQHITGARPGDTHFNSYAQYVSAQLYEVGGLGSNRNKYFEQSIIDKRIKGLAEKFSLRGQDDRAQALEEYLQRIRELSPSLVTTSPTSVVSSSDREAQNVVSSILLILLELSDSPTSDALHRRIEHEYEIPRSLQQYKRTKVDEETKNKALWQSILKEEPLTGDHWATVRDVEAERSDDSDYDEMDLVSVGEKSQETPGTQDQDQSQGHSGSLASAASTHLNRISGPRPCEDDINILQELESIQYWQASNISQRRFIREEEIIRANVDVQDPMSVNAGLERLQSDAVLATTIPMDELDLIHETLLMLLGEYSMCFEYEKHNVIRPRKGITISHISAEALQNVLSDLSVHGTNLKTLDSMATDICAKPIQVIGKVVQTFASSILTIVGEQRQLLSHLQQRYRHPRPKSSYQPQLLVSILELYDDVSRQFSLVADVLHFMKSVFVTEISEQTSCAQASNLLSKLHGVACQAELSGDREAFAKFRDLLRDSVTPLLLSMESWLNGEQMPDEKDFFIKSNPSVDLFSSDFWESGYSFQADISEGIDASLATKLLIPSFFRADDLGTILYIGKAIRIMECIGGLEAFKSRPLNVSFAETLNVRIFGDRKPQGHRQHWNSPTRASKMSGILSAQFPLWTKPKPKPLSLANAELHHPLTLNFTGNTDDLVMPAANFQWLLDRELSQAIKEQYTRINQSIHEVMAKKCQLWWHLEGMCGFYLMMNGEVMNDFSHALFKKLVLTIGTASARRRLEVDSYSLGAMFSNIAEQHRWPMRAFTAVRHHSSAEIQRSSKSLHPTLGQLENVELDYMLPWPLSGFIYPTMANKRMFQRISVFLLQIKVAKHAIEQASFLYSRPNPSPTTRMFWKLRLHLLSVINDIWTYCMTTVLDVQKKDFERELKKRKGSLDLDDLVRFSTAFVRTSHERLFLGSKAAALLRSFKGILELALDFSKWMTSYLAVQNQKAMEEEEGVLENRLATMFDRRSLRRIAGASAGAAGATAQDYKEHHPLRRRVSFGASQILRHTAAMTETDDEEDEEDDEQVEEAAQFDGDLGAGESGLEEDSIDSNNKNNNSTLQRGNDVEHHSATATAHEKRSYDDDGHFLERMHEDVEMAEVPGRVPRSKPKKQKTSLTSAKGTPEQKQQHQQRPSQAQWAGESEDHYFMAKLRDLEQELERRKRFLADNLKIIVQSNVAKRSGRLGDAAQSVNGAGGGENDDDEVSPQESGSSYLNGLIYALSK